MHTYRLTVYTLHTYIQITPQFINTQIHTYIHRYSSSLWTRWRTPFRHPEWTSMHSKVSCESLAISCKGRHEAAQWNEKRVGWPMHVCMLIYVNYVNLILCMYVCMHVPTYICMYVCEYIYTHVHFGHKYVCKYVCMYVYMYVCMYLLIYACMYVNTFIHLYILSVSMYVCMFNI